MTKAERTIDDPLTRQRLRFLEVSGETQRRSLRAEVRLEPGGFVPRHLHLRQDERIEILAGSIRYRTRGEDRIMEPGAGATVPRRRFHRVSNAGPDEARFVLDVRPARHIEQTMRSMFAMGRLLRPLARVSPLGRMLVVWAIRADVVDGDGDRQDHTVGSAAYVDPVTVDGDDFETGRPVGQVPRAHLYRRARSDYTNGTEIHVPPPE
jgi:quercetin dioxygenase-like cupin family protein